MAKILIPFEVSTHSRLKAAGGRVSWRLTGATRFNTQPPEGGWGARAKIYKSTRCFNTQPPEGGWSR